MGAKINVVLNTGQQAIANYTRENVFVWNPRFMQGAYVNNGSYDPETLEIGTVMGRVAATDLLVPFRSNASDGSQYIVGVLAQELVLESGEEKEVTNLVVAGDIVADKLIFVKPGDGLDTIVNSQRVKDKIGRECVGLKLIFDSCEMTKHDNS